MKPWLMCKQAEQTYPPHLYWSLWHWDNNGKFFMWCKLYQDRIACIRQMYCFVQTLWNKEREASRIEANVLWNSGEVIVISKSIGKVSKLIKEIFFMDAKRFASNNKWNKSRIFWKSFCAYIYLSKYFQKSINFKRSETEFPLHFTY